MREVHSWQSSAAVSLNKRASYNLVTTNYIIKVATLLDMGGYSARKGILELEGFYAKPIKYYFFLCQFCLKILRVKKSTETQAAINKT